MVNADISVSQNQLVMDRGLFGVADGQRAVVALVCVEQWSYKETAVALEIPIGTVMSRLYSARKALARELEEHR